MVIFVKHFYSRRTPATGYKSPIFVQLFPAERVSATLLFWFFFSKYKIKELFFMFLLYLLMLTTAAL